MALVYQAGREIGEHHFKTWKFEIVFILLNENVHSPKLCYGLKKTCLLPHLIQQSLPHFSLSLSKLCSCLACSPPVNYLRVWTTGLKNSALPQLWFGPFLNRNLKRAVREDGYKQPAIQRKMNLLAQFPITSDNLSLNTFSIVHCRANKGGIAVAAAVCLKRGRSCGREKKVQSAGRKLRGEVIKGGERWDWQHVQWPGLWRRRTDWRNWLRKKKV